jgi:hypothetical protein
VIAAAAVAGFAAGVVATLFAIWEFYRAMVSPRRRRNRTR